MSVRRLDSTGDYVMGRGNLLLTRSQAVAVLVVLNLRLVRGEWFLDQTAGTAWYGQTDGPAIFGGHADMMFAEAELKRVILSTPGVTGVVKFVATLNHESRRWSVAFTATTEYGELISQEVQVP